MSCKPMGKHGYPERWKDIPGFEGRYQASTEGRIRKAWPGAREPKILTAGPRNRINNGWYVHLFDENGKAKRYPVLRLVAETFCDVPEGKIVVHRNGLHSDNGLRNVAFMTRSQVGKLIKGRRRSRPVVMVDPNGEIVECYPSATQAAKAAGVWLSSVVDRCYGRIQDEFGLIGYSFRWDDEED